MRDPRLCVVCSERCLLGAKSTQECDKDVAICSVPCLRAWRRSKFINSCTKIERSRQRAPSSPIDTVEHNNEMKEMQECNQIYRLGRKRTAVEEVTAKRALRGIHIYQRDLCNKKPYRGVPATTSDRKGDRRDIKSRR